MKSSQKILEVKNIHVSYGSLKVLNDIDFMIKEGEIVAIMGPNGCGKTTTLKSIFGLAPLTQGSVYFNDKKLNPVTSRMVGLGISYVPQGRRVFTGLTVKENLEMGGYFLNNPTEVKRRINDVLGIFPEIKSKLTEKSGNLSGGQQQMLAIARGLITNPKVLLLDEPTLGLSPKIVKEVFQVIKKINQEKGTSIVIVEHNIKSLLPIVDRVYILDMGKVIFTGTGDEFVKSDLFEKVFLGHVS